MADHRGMAQPRIKRYALVPSASGGGVRRFHLARLERMEEIAARDAQRTSAAARDGNRSSIQARHRG
jgi:hypothetical protein